MTGFATARLLVDNRSLEAEVRSVNNRFLKTQIRLPSALAAAEHEFEALIREQITRGTVSLTLRVVDLRAIPTSTLNEEQALRHLEAARRFAAQHLLSADISVMDLFQLPGVLRAIDSETSIDPELSNQAKTLARRVLRDLVQSRLEEAKRLIPELALISGRIRGLVKLTAERAPEVVFEYRDRLKRRLNILLADQPDAAVLRDMDLAREVAIMADRCDISEELQRLTAHLDEFDRNLDLEDDVGRKLEFLLQEMLRETNTIGSKAGDFRITQKVVDMKSDIERLKEQAQNIE